MTQTPPYETTMEPFKDGHRQIRELTESYAISAPIRSIAPLLWLLQPRKEAMQCLNFSTSLRHCSDRGIADNVMSVKPRWARYNRRPITVAGKLRCVKIRLPSKLGSTVYYDPLAVPGKSMNTKTALRLLLSILTIEEFDRKASSNVTLLWPILTLSNPWVC